MAFQTLEPANEPLFCNPLHCAKRDTLREVDYEKILSKRGVSGAKAERTELDQTLDHIRKKDVLVIWKLDRLGRSLSDLLSIVEYLKERGGRPKSLDENQVKVAIALSEAGELTIKEICEQIGCSRATYYRQIAPKLQPASESSK